MFDLPWQEFVFLFGNFIFFIALVPSILSQNKPSFWTCAMTAPMLSIFTFTFISLDMFLSAFGIGTTALAWWILFVQTIPWRNSRLTSE